MRKQERAVMCDLIVEESEIRSLNYLLMISALAINHL